MRLVQISDGATRRVALVEEPRLRLLARSASVYDLALSAISERESLGDFVARHLSDEVVDYDDIYFGRSRWRLLSPADHPQESARCLVSGTGLTHFGSAQNRATMHERGDAELTDSMRMFQLGVAEGRPADGQIGAAPEWFYKGTGSVLQPPGEPLLIPSHAEDGGEEAEVAGVYIVAPDGVPHRLGMVVGNEFSDHVFERKNYLNLAASKMRQCAIGPELVVAPEFESVPGRVAIVRDGQILWKKAVCTGEREMCHSLSNIEHHHFKYDSHRRPGDMHIHYFGAHSLSFGDGIKIADGDVIDVSFAGFGRSLCNPVRVAPSSPAPVKVLAL